jgi:hypothetical protein
MASRSLYPPSVEVHDRHLQNTELQRTESDKQILVDATSRGVVAGLVVSVGSTTTLIDIAAGSAYAPNGEYMQMLVTQSDVSLADYAAGIKNYILLVYDEQISDSESREADGTTSPTKAEVTPRLVVLAEAAYNALPLSDIVLSNNARDRACIVAIVTANGSGVALTTASIQHPTTYGTVISATKTGNISGITLGTIDGNTPIGDGELAYTAYNQSITWKAPTGSTGPSKIISTDGIYTLTSSTGCTLDISVESSLLPLVNKTDIVTITSVYTQSVTRHTAEDFQHRSMLGSGVASTHNPHGLTYADIGGSTGGSVEEHQDMMHANGITRVSNVNTLLATVNFGGAIDDLSITGFTAGSTAYINGILVQTPVSTTTMTWTGIDLTSTQSLWGIWISYTGTITKYLRAQFAGTTLSDRLQILDVVGITGPITLFWYSTGAIKINGGPSSNPSTTDTIIKLYDSSRVNHIVVYIKGGAIPTSTLSDTVTISAEPDPEESMPICNVPFSGLYLGVGSLGYGFGIQSAPNLIYDRRLWGNLDEIDTRIDAGITNSAEVVSNLLGNGIYVRSHVTPGSIDGEVSVATAYADQFALDIVFPNSTINGGIVYVDGHKLDVPTTTVTIANGTNKIYVDSAGIVQCSIASWSSVVANQFNKPIVRLYEVVISGGAYVSYLDIREFVGQKRNVPMGVVGLDVYGRASVGVTGSYTAITGTVTGDGWGGTFTSTTGTGCYVTGVTGGLLARASGVNKPSVEGWPSEATGVGIKGSSISYCGVWGTSSGAGTGVQGDSSSGYGGDFTSTSNYAVHAVGTGNWGGHFTGTSGVYGNGVTGVEGEASGHTGYGIIGRHDTLIAGTTGGTGVVGSSTYAYGVEGVSSGNAGIYGHSSVADGVRGTTTHTSTCGGVSGTFAGAGAITGYGVYGVNSNTTDGSTGYGVYGSCTSAGTGSRIGVYGNGSTYGIYGTGTTGCGVVGHVGTIAPQTVSTNCGVWGKAPGRGIEGYGNSTTVPSLYSVGIGVYGTGSEYGIKGNSTQIAISGSGGITGVVGDGSQCGIYGFSGLDIAPAGSGMGVYGVGFAVGVRGKSDSGNGGWFSSTTGLALEATGNATRAPLSLNIYTTLPTDPHFGDVILYTDSLTDPTCWQIGVYFPISSGGSAWKYFTLI